MNKSFLCKMKVSVKHRAEEKQWGAQFIWELKESLLGEAPEDEGEKKPNVCSASSGTLLGIFFKDIIWICVISLC